MTIGHLVHRINWLLVLGVAVIFGSGLTDARAEMIVAVEETHSTHLREMIEESDSNICRLMSWAEFDSVDIVLGAQANTSVSEDVYSGDEEIVTVFAFLPLLSTLGATSNPLDSSNSTGSVGLAYAALLTIRTVFPEPVLLLYWEGREFFHIPDAPFSSLFRPPRHILLISVI